MNMKKICFLIFSLIIGISSLNAQNKYEIKIKINGVSDTTLYLGHHFGSKQFVIDTTTIDSNGNAVFKGDKELGRGIYLIAMPSRNMTYFEILIGNKQSFSIETDTVDFINNMKIQNSPENAIFNEYQKKAIVFQQKQRELNEEYVKVKGNEDEVRKIIDKSTEINKAQDNYVDSIIANNSNFFFSKILKALKQIEIPEAPTDDEGNVIDPLFQYLYNKDHFFDNIDFAENGLLRTPIYESKVDYFLSKVVIPEPDSLMKETHKLISKAFEGGDSLMYQFTVSHLLNSYDTSRVMGFDAVFVAIAEDWYLNGKAPWADTTLISKISEKVDKVTPNKIGNIAPNLVKMQGIDNKYYNLHDIPGEYTILVFFEPSCGHCKKEIPKLIEQYRDSLKVFNTSIFAVYTKYDREEWTKFVEEKNLIENGWYNVWDGPYPHSNFHDFYNIYSTPVIFVLDKNKKIIGKRIGVEDIKGFLEFYKKKQERLNQNDK
jgi:thiol-disulfide isomerase/thioredoxin